MCTFFGHFLSTPPQRSVPKWRRPNRATALWSNDSPLGWRGGYEYFIFTQNVNISHRFIQMIGFYPWLNDPLRMLPLLPVFSLFFPFHLPQGLFFFFPWSKNEQKSKTVNNVSDLQYMFFRSDRTSSSSFVCLSVWNFIEKYSDKVIWTI